jgi:hypothetical protein
LPLIKWKLYVFGSTSPRIIYLFWLNRSCSPQINRSKFFIPLIIILPLRIQWHFLQLSPRILLNLFSKCLNLLNYLFVLKQSLVVNDVIKVFSLHLFTLTLLI